jgi:hypothetical protein
MWIIILYSYLLSVYFLRWGVLLRSFDRFLIGSFSYCGNLRILCIFWIPVFYKYFLLVCSLSSFLFVYILNYILLFFQFLLAYINHTILGAYCYMYIYAYNILWSYFTPSITLFYLLPLYLPTFLLYYILWTVSFRELTFLFSEVQFAGYGGIQL